MLTRPKISIVTPSLNQVQFLEQTVESVLAQGYPSLEYILIDGGSRDGSVDIIERYADRLSYWISEPDRGQTDAINKGLRRASGDIWAYICSDDTYEPGTFEKVASAFERTDTDVVFGNCNFVNMRGEVTRHKKPGPFDRGRLLRNNYLFQPSIFLRRWILDEFGYFDETLHFSMDYEYWVRISERARFTYVDETFSNYRLHPDSKSMYAIQGMNREGRKVKKQYGVGFAADWEYFRFRFVGGLLYRVKRWLFEHLRGLR